MDTHSQVTEWVNVGDSWYAVSLFFTIFARLPPLANASWCGRHSPHPLATPMGDKDDYTLCPKKVVHKLMAITLSVLKGVFIATQLNWTQLTQLNSVQPSQSCFCLWRHDLQTESTVVHAVELSSVELCRYKHPLSRHFLLQAPQCPVPCENGSAETTVAEVGRNPVAGSPDKGSWHK